MFWHIVLMSGLAPIVAWWAEASGLVDPRVRSSLLAATVLQIVAIYAWHLPSSMQLSLTTPFGMLVTQLSLLVAAVWFWSAVFASLPVRRWHAVAALMATAKLFCLLGVLLVFAPRALYAPAMAHAGLEDQQTAGLLMLAACPVTYLAAAFLATVAGLGGAFRVGANAAGEQP
jgi:putative membrane protein